MLKRRRVDIICTLVVIVIMGIVLLAIPSVRVTGEETQVEEPEKMIETELEEAVEEVAVVATEKAEEIPEFQSLGEFNITAYCACEKCCGVYALNRPMDENGNPIVYGASGEVLIPEYSVAVDPEVIPYGTQQQVCEPKLLYCILLYN